jgi:putative nucleotidyltransferase with HDIG domain
MSTLTADLDAATERRVEESFDRRRRSLGGRELLTILPFSIGFVTAAVALAAFAEPQRALSVPLAMAFVVAYAIADRIEFSTGTGSAVPTQLIFVPMLLLLPTPFVPLLVGLALAASSLWLVARGALALDRALLAGTADSAFALGPALVLVLADAQLPGWSHLPVYAVALAVQITGDTAISALRIGIGLGIPVREVIAEMRLARRVDVLLFPVGLLAALAAADAPAGALLVLALIPLLVGFGREREASIERSLELGRAYRGTALLLRDLLEEDDEYTGHHTEDVVELAVKVAEEMGLDEDARRETEMGALLHDVGKIAVPDSILNKPGRLTVEEFAEMRKHPVHGARILANIKSPLVAAVLPGVQYHHEKWDGTGYPEGLSGSGIPLLGRLLGVADFLDALASERAYHAGKPIAEVVQLIADGAGVHFDPEIADAVVRLHARGALNVDETS